MYIKQGFSLIELMVVIAIVAVLSAVAVPAYKDYRIKTKVHTLFPVSDMLIKKQIEYFNKNGTFGDANAFYSGESNPALVPSAISATFSPYINSVSMSVSACGSDGRPYSDIRVVTKPGVTGVTIVIVYNVIDKNGSLSVVCSYDPFFSGGQDVTKYLPSACHTPTNMIPLPLC